MRNAGRAGHPNARFIVLDPNGEYAKAFADRGDQLRLFRVPPVVGTEKELDVPAWLWSGHEWTAVAHAAPGTQRPLLLRGIRELKSDQTEELPREVQVRRYIHSYLVQIRDLLGRGVAAFTGNKKYECRDLLQNISSDCEKFQLSVQEPWQGLLGAIINQATDLVAARRSGPQSQYVTDFSVADIEAIRDKLTAYMNSVNDEAAATSISEDAPLPFDVNLLADHLDRIAAGQGNLAGFISTLGLRIRSMLADQRLGTVIGKSPPTKFEDWLKDYVGDDGATNGPLAVIDLSLVPSEIVHIVVAVLARVIFESLQRYRRLQAEGLSLPTVLVLEEAHTFIRRGKDDEGSASSPSQLCREIFERIAREGRKFGLGLVLSSQRPSELSPTVLAQCNTFILHRIVNDSDQNLVARLVPDNVGGLLRDLPSLPSKQAILLGWATPIPVLIEIDELAQEHQPQSADPEFWDVWTCAKERKVDWGAIASQWSTPVADIPVQSGQTDALEPVNASVTFPNPPNGANEPPN